jgi:hypothetical protein
VLAKTEFHKTDVVELRASNRTLQTMHLHRS